ncbi:MAG: rubrerythrin family protein [Dehalococcoidales bacterium]
MAYQTENIIQDAFGGECKASQRYLLFAEKADKEGYPHVAKLFRAVAAAEIVHARNHFSVLDAVGATKDNLLGASMGERLEFTQMYPTYIEIARKEMNDRAERSFDWANKVEKIHYGYFDKAFKEMKDGKQPADATYYVCQVCGNTVKDNVPDKCPICGSTAKAFKKVE